MHLGYLTEAVLVSHCRKQRCGPSGWNTSRRAQSAAALSAAGVHQNIIVSKNLPGVWCLALMLAAVGCFLAAFCALISLCQTRYRSALLPAFTRGRSISSRGRRHRGHRRIASEDTYVPRDQLLATLPQHKR